MIHPYRIGVLGGMGPLAGVELQRRIIAATPAKKDQDHIQVVCFTNPHIPDRTASLQTDGGSRFRSAIQQSLAVLEQVEVDVIAIPCNTAHAQMGAIQSFVATPIVNMIEITMDYINEKYAPDTKVALLATQGTIDTGLYHNHGGVEWIIPPIDTQQKINSCIALTKAGKVTEAQAVIHTVAQEMKQMGSQVLLLGCTELSLFDEVLRREGYKSIDPLQLVANHLVAQASVLH